MCGHVSMGARQVEARRELFAQAAVWLQPGQGARECGIRCVHEWLLVLLRGRCNVRAPCENIHMSASRKKCALQRDATRHRRAGNTEIAGTKGTLHKEKRQPGSTDQNHPERNAINQALQQSNAPCYNSTALHHIVFPRVLTVLSWLLPPLSCVLVTEQWTGCNMSTGNCVLYHTIRTNAPILCLFVTNFYNTN
jgi:hypothetical protein